MGDIRFVCRPAYCLSLRIFRRIYLHLQADIDIVCEIGPPLPFYLIIRKTRNILRYVKRNFIKFL